VKNQPSKILFLQIIVNFLIKGWVRVEQLPNGTEERVKGFLPLKCPYSCSR